MHDLKHAWAVYKSFAAVAPKFVYGILVGGKQVYSVSMRNDIKALAFDHDRHF